MSSAKSELLNNRLLWGSNTNSSWLWARIAQNIAPKISPFHFNNQPSVCKGGDFKFMRTEMSHCIVLYCKQKITVMLLRHAFTSTYIYQPYLNYSIFIWSLSTLVHTYLSAEASGRPMPISSPHTWQHDEHQRKRTWMVSRSTTREQLDQLSPWKHDPWKQACLCLSLAYFDNLPTVIWQQYAMK